MNLHTLDAQQPVSLGHHDAAPHPEAAAEWWYFQGQVDFAGTAHDVMVMVVRSAPKQSGQAPGWLLLKSLRAENERDLAVTSVASTSTSKIAAASSRDLLVDAGMPEALADAYVDELTRRGAPAPVRLSEAPVRESQNRLELTWEDLSLAQKSNYEFEVAFELPGHAKIARFTLSPAVDWFWDPAYGAGSNFGSMAYASCPRMLVAGEMAGEPITGEVWFDHQWGDRGWFEPSQGENGTEALCWAWIAINLDDTRHLLVGRGEDLFSGRIVDTSALLLGDGPAPQRAMNASVEPVAFWQSPDTHAPYPISWRITIPQFDADMIYTPASDASEIPIYGHFTAVWEGAGHVEGQFGGQPISCRGHLELFGYATPAGFDRAQEAWIKRIDSHIERLLPKSLDNDWLTDTIGPARWPYLSDAHDPMLSQPTWELLARSGKHWRSVFGILTLRALGVDVAPYEVAITVIPELIHAGSLMIDDIQDHSAMRRGGPAIHTTYGEAETINTANWLYFLPLKTLENHPALDTAQREEIYRIIVDLFIRAHAGQAQDLFASALDREHVALHEPASHAEKALQTYVLKTAAPVKAIASIVCVIARADAETRAACETYGELAGVAYQIMDDVRNIDSGQELGKDLGEDIREGKLTYALLRALDRLDAAGRAQLFAILATPGEDTSEAQLHEAIEIVRATGALEACRAEAREMVETAWEALSAHVPASVSKTMVRLMFTRLFAEV